MKKVILLFLFPVLSHIVMGQQQNERVLKLVDEGIEMHDEGDYKGALAKYDEALKIDKDNALALGEKALTLFALRQYKESLQCAERAINKNPESDALRSVYVTYGNAYDNLKEPDKALAAYDKGIKLFPGEHQLYYNKGVTLVGMKRYDEAMTCFQQLALLNPNHPGTQHAIASLADAKGMRIPALMAYCRFLVLEPVGERAKMDFGSLQRILKKGVEQKDGNTIGITLDENIVSDKKKENDFGIADMTLLLQAALDYSDENKEKTDVELFIAKLETLCASLSESQKDNYGFFWDYYAPYFSEIRNKKLIEPFAYLLFVNGGGPDVGKWIKSHKSDLEKFYAWSLSFEWKKN